MERSNLWVISYLSQAEKLSYHMIQTEINLRDFNSDRNLFVSNDDESERIGYYIIKRT